LKEDTLGGTIVNRIDRIARQAISLHATLRPRIAEGEPVSFDGLVSFDESQYFPTLRWRAWRGRRSGE
jgi:hypothetical protein